MLGQSIGSSWRVECLAIYILVPLMCVVRAALRLGVEIATRRSATGSALQQFSLTCWHAGQFSVVRHPCPHFADNHRCLPFRSPSQTLREPVRSLSWQGWGGAARSGERVCLSWMWMWTRADELRRRSLDSASSRVPCVLYSLHRWPLAYLRPPVATSTAVWDGWSAFGE
jgi:hypothetical protein